MVLIFSRKRKAGYEFRSFRFVMIKGFSYEGKSLVKTLNFATTSRYMECTARQRHLAIDLNRIVIHDFSEANQA